MSLQVANRAASWLRYRRVVLPLGWEQLADLAFDVIITSHMIQRVSDAEEGEEQTDTATQPEENEVEEDRVDDTLTSLLTHACPGESSTPILQTDTHYLVRTAIALLSSSNIARTRLKPGKRHETEL